MSQIFSPDSLKRLNSNKEATIRARRRRRDDKQKLGVDDNDDDDDDDDKDDDDESHISLKSSTLSMAVPGVMTQSRWRIKLDSSSGNKRANFEQVCSICLRESSELGDSTLVTPCLCTGSRSRQHKSCIEDWIEQSGATSCPFCGVRYDFERGKKGFFCYIRECELQGDFLVNLAATLYSVYLILVGLSVCYNYLYFEHGCESALAQRRAENLELFNAVRWKSWSDLEQVLECRRSIRSFDQLHSWPSIVLFCFTCIGTILLLIGILSLCLNMTFRHYVKYILWSRTNYKVTIKAYRLDVLDSSERASSETRRM